MYHIPWLSCWLLLPPFPATVTPASLYPRAARRARAVVPIAPLFHCPVSGPESLPVTRQRISAPLPIPAVSVRPDASHQSYAFKCCPALAGNARPHTHGPQCPMLVTHPAYAGCPPSPQAELASLVLPIVHVNATADHSVDSVAVGAVRVAAPLSVPQRARRQALTVMTVSSP